MVNPLKAYIISFMLKNRQNMDLNIILLVSLTLQVFTMGWWIPKGSHHCQLCHQAILISRWGSLLWRIWISIHCKGFPYTRCIQEGDNGFSTLRWLEEYSSVIGLGLDHQQLICTAGEDGLLQLSRTMESGVLDLSRRPANFRSRIKDVNACVHPDFFDSRL